MATIDAWNVAHPSETSLGSQLDDGVREFVSSIASTLNESMLWPSTTTAIFLNAGNARAGSARLSYGGSLKDYPNGTLSMQTDRHRIQHIGSTESSVLGHGALILHGGTCNLNHRWLHQTGTASATQISGQTTKSVTFDTIYLGTPHVDAAVSDIDILMNVSTITTGGFTSLCSNMVATASAVFSMRWSSEGTVAQ